MDNFYKVLNKDGYQIGLLGIADPAIHQTEGDYLWDDGSGYAREQLDNLLEDTDTLNIPLSHRPELFHVQGYERRPGFQRACPWRTD